MGRSSGKRNIGGLKLYKLAAAGNDFILFSAFPKPVSFYRRLARRCCRRHYALGADGLLVIEEAGKKLKMRIFNPDGSEAEMCGNGARCAALWIYLYKKQSKELSFSTQAGEIEAVVSGIHSSSQPCTSFKAAVRLKMTTPSDLKLNFSLPLEPRPLKVNFVNSGVPHTVIFAAGLEKIDVARLGPLVRYHEYFAPAGTNVDFVEALEDDFIKVRTYERGVEKETLACGTGIVASAILYKLREGSAGEANKVKVLARSGDVLEVSFKHKRGSVFDVWLKGGAYLVGEVLV